MKDSDVYLANDFLGGKERLHRASSVLYFLEILNEWMKDPAVTEICINRPFEVFIEKEAGWKRYDVPKMDYEHLESFGTAVAKFVENEISDVRPVLSAVLPRGERIQVVMPPACEHNTISVTIRKPSFVLRTMDDYMNQGFFERIRPVSKDFSPEEEELLKLKKECDYAGFMKLAVKQGKVIVIAGETGSGKTTFMKGLMQEIPTTQRLITIEDVPELFLPNHPNHVHLFYPSEAKEDDPVTSSSLLKSCLRMKPDRILLAELRGGETFDFINICASGHAGSITSCHAGSAELTFERLALMILQSNKGRTLPYAVIRRLLYMTIDIVLHVTNTATGGRHITEIWYDPAIKRERA
jgi:type IV secretion system protein VirB11